MSTDIRGRSLERRWNSFGREDQDMNPYNTPAELRKTGVMFSEDEQGFHLRVCGCRYKRTALPLGTRKVHHIFAELVSRGRVSSAGNRYWADGLVCRKEQSTHNLYRKQTLNFTPLCPSIKIIAFETYKGVFICIYKIFSANTCILIEVVRTLTPCTSRKDNLRTSELFSYLGWNLEAKISRNDTVNIVVYYKIKLSLCLTN
jgi:hypothetical protein